MEDPADIIVRIERLDERVKRQSDYGTLLARGRVMRDVDEVDDPRAWRAEIKRQARADRIKVRTGVTDSTLWALTAAPLSEPRREEGSRYFHLYHALLSQAELRGHVMKVEIRDREEAAFSCERCGALGYADAASGPLTGGSLFEADCSPQSRL